jgi:hypothetical protein
MNDLCGIGLGDTAARIDWMHDKVKRFRRPASGQPARAYQQQWSASG